MKTRTALIAIAIAISAFSAPQAGEVEILADFRPGTLLLGNETKDFEAIGSNPNLREITELEDAGNLSSIPNVRLGVGWRSEETFIDLAADIGVLVNERFRGLMLGGDFAFQYRFRKNIAVGPHIGLAFFMDPEWTGDADIEFDDTAGIIGGLQVAIGYDILFVFSIDYLHADPFEVSNVNSARMTPRGWTVTDDELDISGLAIQFGMQGRF